MSDYTKDPFERCYDGAVMNAVWKANEVIGRKLGFTPRESYSVGTDTSSVMSPQEESWPPMQRSICEKWIAEHKEYCERNGYTLRHHEYWPMFHRDWNALMEAYKRGSVHPERFICHRPGMEIRSTWEILAEACGADLSLIENWKPEERASALRQDSGQARSAQQA